MQTLLQDIKLALRALLKSKLVAGLAIGSLSLAIAGNSTVFSLVQALLLRPFPYPEPDRIVFVSPTNQSQEFGPTLVSQANFLDWQRRATSFENLAAFGPRSMSLVDGDRPESVIAMAASQSVFPILGAKAILGRTFLPEEDVPGRHRAVLLSYRFWENRFGSDPGLIGQDLDLGGEHYAVVGILAEEFDLLDPRVQLFVPLAPDAANLPPRNRQELLTIARLKAGVTVEAAQKEMSTIARHLEAEYPEENRDYGVRVATFRDTIVDDRNRQMMGFLQGILIFVLLIASANIANLLLARGQDRQREIALRAALGARRGRIVRQLLTESLTLAVCGGVLGVLLGLVGIDLMRAGFGNQLPKAFTPEMDGQVLLFTLAIAAFAGLVFGTAPALQASKPNLTAALREGGQGGTVGSRRRLVSRALVVAQVALALVMLSGAGLMVQSFRDLQNAPSGFDVENLLTLALSPPESRYAEDRQVSDFYVDLVGRLEGLPGVSRAAVTSTLPQTPLTPTAQFTLGGRDTPEGTPPPDAIWLAVSEGYLETLGIPVLRGRSFTVADRAGSPPVVLINEAMARRFWPEESPVGRRIQILGASREIVGVAGNIRQNLVLGDAGGPQETVYLPHRQHPIRAAAVVLRTAGDPHSLASAARTEIWRLDPSLAPSQVLSMQEFLDQFYVGVKVVNTLLGVFGMLALFLAAVGIYGVIAFSVARRTNELGVRIALGARGIDILRLVTREGLILTAIGFVLGLPGVLLSFRAVSAMMAGIAPVAPLTAAGVAAVLLVVAGLASFLPARRAAALDPVTALRFE